MALTYTPPTGPALTLPQGLRWGDEFDWTPLVQSSAYSLAGALIIEEAERLAGRPLTLVGGLRYAWLSLAELRALHSALALSDPATIELHDGRRFRVVPDRTGEGPLDAAPVPVVLDSGFADPPDTARYYIDTLRLLILEELA